MWPGWFDTNVVDGFWPLLNCHVMTAADTAHKVTASKHVYMYRSMMWYKRGRGGGGM